MVLGALLAGCTPGQGGWDATALAQRYERLAKHPGHRLGDARPYFAPRGEGLVLFLCHWSTDREVRVSLPVEASPEERRILHRSLEAWEELGLGIVFREVSRPLAQLRIDFVAPDESGKPTGSANTAADCRVKPPEGGWRVAQGRVDAELVRASIHLRRENSDLLGRPVVLREDQFAGAVLHELGHALGYPTHAVVGDTLMGRSVDHVRRQGKRVLAGLPLEAPSVAALYELPSGVVVGTASLGNDARRRLYDLDQRARRGAWQGPDVRVGDRSSRIAWWDETGRPVGFLVLGLLAGDEEGVRWIPTSAARERGL